MIAEATGPIKYGVINQAGTATLQAAVTGKKIRVLSYTLVAGAIETVTFNSAAAGTAISGAMQLLAKEPYHAAFHPGGHFETIVSELLELLQAGSVAIDGHFTYQEVA